MFSDVLNQKRQRIISTLAWPIVRFHQEANVASRDFTKALAWMHDMCNGGVFQHLGDMVNAFNSVDNLDFLGFERPTRVPTISEDSDEHLDILSQSALAENMGTFFVHAFGLRAKRCLGLICGWPTRRVLFGHQNRTVRRNAIDDFRGAWNRYVRMLVNVDNAVARSLRSESMFNWAANKVIHRQLEVERYEPTDRLAEYSNSAGRRFITSQIAEDGFHCLKGACDRAGNRDMGDVTCMHTMITSSELHERHKFEWLNLSGAPPVRNAVLPPDCFVARENESHWKVMREVKGFSDKTAWGTPQAVTTSGIVAWAIRCVNGRRPPAIKSICTYSGRSAICNRIIS